MKNELKRTAIAILPLLVLVVLLALDISVFGADSILGASQVALLTAAGICVLLSVLFYKTPWKEFEGAVSSYVGDLATAILILLMIGAVSGTWTVSGVVPAFICYGIKIISPKVFLLTACILCAIVSVMTGSSWTTIATVGVALIGIGKASQRPLPPAQSYPGPISETRYPLSRTPRSWPLPSTACPSSHIYAI